MNRCCKMPIPNDRHFKPGDLVAYATRINEPAKVAHGLGMIVQVDPDPVRKGWVTVFWLGPDPDGRISEEDSEDLRMIR